MKHFGGVDPQNISRMGFRQIFGGCTPPKYLTDGVPSNIWGLYTPKIFDGWGSVKYLGGLQSEPYMVREEEIDLMDSGREECGNIHQNNKGLPSLHFVLT